MNGRSIALFGFAGLLMMFVCLSACNKKHLVETEPNDSFGSASPIQLDAPIEGWLSTRDDQDFYRLVIEKPIILDIKLSPVKGVNHAIKIWKGEDAPELIKMIDDFRKSSPERMCNLSVSPGIYYISVLHGERDLPRGNAENSYTLTVSEHIAEAEETEPNDSISSANPLELDREIKGYFSPAYNRLSSQSDNKMREEDWYSLQIKLENGKPALLDVSLGGVPGVNSVISIFNESMEQIGTSDVNGTGEGEVLNDIGIHASGVYYILAASKNFEANNDVPYRLRAVIREYDSSTEMEPNNDAERANPLGENEMSGRIYPGGDRDYFIFKNNCERCFFRVEAVPPQNMDLVITLLNSEKTKIFESDNSGAGEREVMPNILPAGDFFILISARRDYFEKDNTYKLNVSRLSPGEEMESEPNDRKEAATKLTGNTIIGFTSKKKDVDYYLLEYKRRARKIFALTGVKGAKLRISVTDPYGYAVKTGEVDGARTVSLREMIDQKGYIIIESLSENYDEPYTLQIREAK